MPEDLFAQPPEDLEQKGDDHGVQPPGQGLDPGEIPKAHVQGGKPHHKDKGRQDETRGPGQGPGWPTQTLAHVGGELHHGGPGHHLAQGQAIQKVALVQPFFLFHDPPPDGLDHGQAAVGCDPQVQENPKNFSRGGHYFN